MVEGHVALALVVPLVGTGGGLVVVLVVDLGLEAGVDAADDVGGEEPGGCVPLLQPEVEHLAVGPHRVEQAPVIHPFVQVVEIVGVVECPALFRVLVDHWLDRVLHQLYQPAFQKRPSGGRRYLCRPDFDQLRDRARLITCHAINLLNSVREDLCLKHPGSESPTSHPPRTSRCCRSK